MDFTEEEKKKQEPSEPAMVLEASHGLVPLDENAIAIK
jgi:hypothetical protein